MPSDANFQDLNERLAIIENMLAEGRRTTESWGGTFILWGVAYYIATAWATWGESKLAWPVTMIAASVLTGILISRKTRNQPDTTMGRAVFSIWLAMGISIFLLLIGLGVGGHCDLHIAIAIVGAMIGMANATSSLILKWKMQFASAVVWWACSIVACFGNDQQTQIAFLVTIFLCQIVFGIYCMIAESSQRARASYHA